MPRNRRPYGNSAILTQNFQGFFTGYVLLHGVFIYKIDCKRTNGLIPSKVYKFMQPIITVRSF